MSEADVAEWLDAHHWGLLATASAAGPHVSPVECVLFEGRLYAYAAAVSLRARNLEEVSRVALCVDGPVAGRGPGRRYVVVHATARVLEESDPLLESVRPACARVRSDDAAGGAGGAARLWIELDPYRYESEFVNVETGDRELPQ